MQVTGGGSGSDLQSEINITPLIDVVLVLLIIFMVVVPLLMQGYEVDVPRLTSDPSLVETVEAQVVLSVGPQACRILDQPEGKGLPEGCKVGLGDREIPVAELPASVAVALGNRPPEKRVLFLAADDRLNYEGVLRIVDLAKTGVPDLTIEVVTAETEAATP